MLIGWGGMTSLGFCAMGVPDVASWTSVRVCCLWRCLSGLGERSLVVAVCVCGNTGRVAIDVRGRERSRVLCLRCLQRVLCTGSW